MRFTAFLLCLLALAAPLAKSGYGRYLLDLPGEAPVT